ncbi:MAG: hypothetical protein PHO48_00600 [Candidatus Gracilibacteria bacterium]|nr:hypothetical protein [Candidatus Gracilibacteria bacterium]MDD5179248.1 hypothetical protein [Candidatus Gracilibacteria bacterium]
MNKNQIINSLRKVFLDFNPEFSFILPPLNPCERMLALTLIVFGDKGSLNAFTAAKRGNPLPAEL